MTQTIYFVSAENANFGGVLIKSIPYYQTEADVIHVHMKTLYNSLIENQINCFIIFMIFICKIAINNIK